MRPVLNVGWLFAERASPPIVLAMKRELEKSMARAGASIDRFDVREAKPHEDGRRVIAITAYGNAA